MLLERGSQDSDVGIAVHGNVVDATLASVNRTQSNVKGVVVHTAAGVQQGSVDVEQIRVEAAPIKAFSHTSSVSDGEQARCRSLVERSRSSRFA
jgi:hypothetical protein